MLERCDFRFGKDGPFCQKSKNHEGSHTWSSAVALREKSIVPRPSAEADDALGTPFLWRDEHHD
jgi:hypothetical protein